jgi:hypothetical protein
MIEHVPAPIRVAVGDDAEEILRLVREHTDADLDALRLQLTGSPTLGPTRVGRLRRDTIHDEDPHRSSATSKQRASDTSENALSRTRAWSRIRWRRPRPCRSPRRILGTCSAPQGRSNRGRGRTVASAPALGLGRDQRDRDAGVPSADDACVVRERARNAALPTELALGDQERTAARRVCGASA